MARSRRLLGIVGLAAAALFFSGCVTDDCVGADCGPGVVIVADLEVSWSIEGGLSSSLCDDYAVDHWIVTATGPEERQVIADCYDDAWDTGTLLYALEEGRYSIDLAAIDYDGYDVGGQATSFDLYDTGLVETVEFVLYPSDLGF